MRIPRQSTNPRRAWGLAFVVIILAAAHFWVFAVSERATYAYAAQKEITDVRAVRFAMKSTLDLVVANAERWAESGSKMTQQVGEYEIEIVSGPLPKARPADSQPERPVALPRSDNSAYRLLTLSTVALSPRDIYRINTQTADDGSAPIGSRTSRRHWNSFRLERRYLAMWEAGEPMRLIFFDEKRSGVDVEEWIAASKVAGKIEKTQEVED
jgi:hypothetical protein